MVMVAVDMIVTLCFLATTIVLVMMLVRPGRR